MLGIYLHFMKKAILRDSFSQKKRGFSLVEVTIALGLVSFAVITIMGLLPTGLSTLRQAMNQTVEAQIVRTIGAQSVIAPFTNLASRTYFDEEGLPTDSTDAYYTVDVTTQPPVFPGVANAGVLTNSLTALKIQIVARKKTNSYTLEVANAGK